MSSLSAKIISQCFIKPKFTPKESKLPYNLTMWDLSKVPAYYMQNGLLFLKPSEAYKQPVQFMQTLLEKLKHTLSLTLVHYYPLAGRLVTLKNDDPKLYSIFVDCNNSPGVGFINASVDMTVSDILRPKYVPSVVHSFFDHHKVISHDGHTHSLASVKVTELVDGVFIGLSMNRAMGDGCSFWRFFNSWSEMFQAHEHNSNLSLTNPPIFKRWFPDGYGPVLSLPYHPDEFKRRDEPPIFKERIFQFSSETVRSLKEKANQGCKIAKISSLQSLAALLWRCIIRASQLSLDQETNLIISANNRVRLNPPLSLNYFGNCVSKIGATATVGDLLEQDLGWAAFRLHEAVDNHSNEKIHQWIDEWVRSPFHGRHHPTFKRTGAVAIASSPRFNQYGIEFGMGKAVALRSGHGNKSDGKILVHPGREGGGSIDLEVCLIPESMDALESDQELMSLVFS